MQKPYDKIIHEELLPCGYKRCCPTVRIYESGRVELTDDDVESGSVGTIKLATREQALALAKKITEKLR